MRGNPVKTGITYIGSGRSADVYYSVMDGREIATKIFLGETISKAILFVLTGSANPYTWCKNAIRSSVSRRHILQGLCQYWFDDQLRLPLTHSHRWNSDAKAFEINAEFIRGSHAPLLNPLIHNPKDYMAVLKNEIMVPLQDKLIESGFDGMVWQAGKGNPVGASNFMVRFQENNSYRWIWIDLESGLPALFSINPLTTLFYYLPMCIKHKGWLFDDVDTVKLKNYLEEHRISLQQKLGEEKLQQIISEYDGLEQSQHKWKNLSRLEKGLEYAVSQERITGQEHAFYLNHPWRWFLKNSKMLVGSMAKTVADKTRAIVSYIRNFRYKKMYRRVYRYFTNAFYRWGVIRWFLKREIEQWYSRKFLTDAQRQLLREELHNDDVSAYLTDFSIHLGLKPFVKTFTWGVLPVLVASQTVSLTMAALLIIWTGPFVRTVYTLWRISHSLVKSRPHHPWVALGVGALPVVGNLAYPMELLYQSSSGNRNKLGRFISYSFSAKVGSNVPVWGGKDSEIEHLVTRICHKSLGWSISKSHGHN